MKKLKLDLDQIQVISFSPQTTHGGSRGTVEGLGETDPDVFTWPTCNEYQTCEGFICPNIDDPTLTTDPLC